MVNNLNVCGIFRLRSLEFLGYTSVSFPGCFGISCCQEKGCRQNGGIPRVFYFSFGLIMLFANFSRVWETRCSLLSLYFCSCSWHIFCCIYTISGGISTRFWVSLETRAKTKSSELTENWRWNGTLIRIRTTPKHRRDFKIWVRHMRFVIKIILSLKYYYCVLFTVWYWSLEWIVRKFISASLVQRLELGNIAIAFPSACRVNKNGEKIFFSIYNKASNLCLCPHRWLLREFKLNISTWNLISCAFRCKPQNLYILQRADIWELEVLFLWCQH